MFSVEIFGLQIGISITIILLAFICELINSMLGGGHGALMAPILMLMGFSPLSVVPSVLLAEIISGFLVSIAHHRFGNVNFRMDSRHLHVALLLGGCSVIGTVIAVVTALRLPANILETYIGILIVSIGLIVLFSLNIRFPFSWKKMAALGIFASFNKGISGGGYGPIITVGQMLSGFNSKESVSVSSLAKTLTCAIGFVAYVILSGKLDTLLLPSLVLGSIFSVPISAIVVKRLREKNLRILIGIIMISLGVSMLVRIFVLGMTA